MNQPWPAPYADEPIVTRVSIPGSKSLTNRALVLAALADSPSTLRAPLIARDTSLMADALESLGAQITRKDDAWHITPISAFTNATVDCGLAGTVMRFVPVIAALSAGSTQFDGDPRAYERPMGATISALRALGATVDDDGRETLPFTVTGGPQVTGGQLEIDASASSQFVSALLLVGARLESGLDLAHRGDSLPSLPHIEMTITELRRRGVQVDVSDSRWFVHPGPIRGVDLVIEPDLSNAGAFIAAALATGGSVAIAHWPTETDQAGAAWLELVTEFGGRAERNGTDMVFHGPAELSGVDLDLHDVGELTPVVAALAALASSPSRLSGIAHLRGHETDRLAALRVEINRLGGDVTEFSDGLEIKPATLTGGEFLTYHDHRMAHAAAVLGLRVRGVTIENIETTSKTYPEFASTWLEMVAQ